MRLLSHFHFAIIHAVAHLDDALLAKGLNILFGGTGYCDVTWPCRSSYVLTMLFLRTMTYHLNLVSNRCCWNTCRKTYNNKKFVYIKVMKDLTSAPFHFGILNNLQVNMSDDFRFNLNKIVIDLFIFTVWLIIHNSSYLFCIRHWKLKISCDS